MSNKRAINRHNRVITSFVRIPKPLEDGKARCAGCSAVVTLTSRGRLRLHKTPGGEECPYRVVVAEPVHLDELPPVNIPQDRVKAKSNKRPKGEPSRLEAGSTCRECSKWLPGERSLCGACAVRINSTRRRA